MRFTEILDRSVLPRGTLHRQLSNLVEEGLLSLGSDHSYSMGLRLLGFASRAWAGNEFRSVAEPHLHHLNEATGETVHLGILNGTEIVYLDKVESRRRFRMYSQIGIASPVYCTGVGKAALSALPDDRLRDIVRSIRFKRYHPAQRRNVHAIPRRSTGLAEASAASLQENSRRTGCRAGAEFLVLTVKPLTTRDASL